MRHCANTGDLDDADLELAENGAASADADLDDDWDLDADESAIKEVKDA